MKVQLTKILSYFIPAIILLSTFSCVDNNNDDDDINPEPEYQLIDSLITDKDTIWSGPQDPATITCYATGDNLTYQWFSELGDIQAQNPEGSKIVFTAADCCEGVREIFCTVGDGVGEDTDTIPLYVLVDYSK
jgi:hypothetical protein